MPIQVNLNELEAPPPAPAPAPQQVPSWAQPSNRTERRCVATNDVTVRAAAALDSEVVGELRAGDHCTVAATASSRDRAAATPSTWSSETVSATASFRAGRRPAAHQPPGARRRAVAHLCAAERVGFDAETRAGR